MANTLYNLEWEESLRLDKACPISPPIFYHHSHKRMVSSCKDLHAQVAICLQRSPCVLIERHTPKDCLEKPELRQDVPEQCLQKLFSYMECRRGMIDMRKRFRGNGPISTGRYDTKLADLSSGKVDIEEELNILSDTIGTK